MENKLFALIAESRDESGRTTFIECLGIFMSIYEALGKAVMHLSDIADGYDYECEITSIYELNAQTGYAIALRDEKHITWEVCNVLEIPEDPGRRARI